LDQGQRFDIKPGSPEMRLADFARYGVRLESSSEEDPMAAARAAAEQVMKARPTMQLFADNNDRSWSQIMWRIALPLAALNLALLAIPLGAVNPRLGRSGGRLMGGLVALLYMNLSNLSRGWIGGGKLSFGIGVWAVHAVFAALTAYLLYRRLRVKAPRDPGVAPGPVEAARR